MRMLRSEKTVFNLHAWCETAFSRPGHSRIESPGFARARGECQVQGAYAYLVFLQALARRATLDQVIVGNNDCF